MTTLNQKASESAELKTPIRSAFESQCERISISKLLPLKKLQPHFKASTKYQQILASVQEVGLVEPPAVRAVPNQRGNFFLLDGHVRIEILKDLGIADVDCLVALEDDTYSYNKQINKLSAVQDHRMIVKAMERGVSAERLGKSLGLSAQNIRNRFRLLNGICNEAANILADTPCPAKIFTILRNMKPLRQIEVAELMVGNRNFSSLFANALFAATPPTQLVNDGKTLGSDNVTSGSIAKLERELAALQMQGEAVQDSYGRDVVHLTVIRAYLSNLLENATVVRWIANHQPEYLKEFQTITDLTELPSSEVDRGRRKKGNQDWASDGTV